MEINNETTSDVGGVSTESQGESAQTPQTTTANAGTGAQSTTGEGAQTAQATGAGNDGAVSQGTGTGAQNDPTQAWKPSFKFKVKDKELEFDDFVKPIIKTKDLEQKFKDLYEKAHGLDEVKTSREAFKQQVEEWKGKYSQVENSLQTLGAYVKKGDFRTFFQALNIPKDKIIQYAIEELKYQELSPEQRQQVDLQRQQQTEFEMAQTQNQTLQTQMAQMIQRQTEMELSQELAKPEIVSAITAYETQLGKAGAFKAEVIRRGQYYEAVHKISPPASQLVSEVLALVGVQAQTQQGSQAASQSTPSQVVQNQQAKPVISSFQGGGAKSPAKRVPTSIEDLRKMRQQLTT